MVWRRARKTQKFLQAYRVSKGLVKEKQSRSRDLVLLLPSAQREQPCCPRCPHVAATPWSCTCEACLPAGLPLWHGAWAWDLAACCKCPSRSPSDDELQADIGRGSGGAACSRVCPILPVVKPLSVTCDCCVFYWLTDVACAAHLCQAVFWEGLSMEARLLLRLSVKLCFVGTCVLHIVSLMLWCLHDSEQGLGTRYAPLWFLFWCHDRSPGLQMRRLWFVLASPLLIWEVAPPLSKSFLWYLFPICKERGVEGGDDFHSNKQKFLQSVLLSYWLCLDIRNNRENNIKDLRVQQQFGKGGSLMWTKAVFSRGQVVETGYEGRRCTVSIGEIWLWIFFKSYSLLFKRKKTIELFRHLDNNKLNSFISEKRNRKQWVSFLRY